MLEDNFFELFGIPESYTVDGKLLRERFRDLQKKFHPDNYATANQQERRLSAQYAALINEAFTTLNEPVQRGRYMLQEQDMSLDDEKDTQMEPAFLMQQIELREELDEAKSSSLNELNRLNVKVDEEFLDRTSALSGLFNNSSAEKLGQARNLVRELQFLSRMRKEIEQAEESFY
jgi:molecular chaperone HscB